MCAVRFSSRTRDLRHTLFARSCFSHGFYEKRSESIGHDTRQRRQRNRDGPRRAGSKVRALGVCMCVFLKQMLLLFMAHRRHATCSLASRFWRALSLPLFFCEASEQTLAREGRHPHRHEVVRDGRMGSHGAFGEFCLVSRQACYSPLPASRPLYFTPCAPVCRRTVAPLAWVAACVFVAFPLEFQGPIDTAQTDTCPPSTRPPRTTSHVSWYDARTPGNR